MSKNGPIIYLVDDDPSFLPAMSRLLSAVGYAVRAFNSPGEFLKEASNLPPGCVVLDLQMPGLTGFDLQEALGRLEDPPPVVFLTGQGDIPAAVRAMKHGAEDFLSKRAPKEDLLAAIQRALARGARERTERLRLKELRARFDTLTSRERQVLAHVLRGQLNKQIAADLRLSERTVKYHRTSLSAKMQVHSVAELTRLVQEADLLSSLEPI